MTASTWHNPQLDKPVSLVCIDDEVLLTRADFAQMVHTLKTRLNIEYCWRWYVNDLKVLARYFCLKYIL